MWGEGVWLGGGLGFFLRVVWGFWGLGWLVGAGWCLVFGLVADGWRVLVWCLFVGWRLVRELGFEGWGLR